MTTTTEIFTSAVAHHQMGHFADAEAAYRQILATDPNNVAVLNNLGLLAPQDEAVTLFQRALAILPDYLDALVNLAKCLHARGEFDGAVASYKRVMAINPDHPDIPFSLGSIFQAQGKFDDAIPWYERAVTLKPDFVAALYNLGTIHAVSNRYGPAAKWYRWALTIDPDLVGAKLNMVTILESDGRLAEAKIFRQRIPRPQDLIVETAPEPRRTVLILETSGQGNVPTEILMPRRTTTRIKWRIDYATDDQEANLPPCDVVFNAIGNADVADEAFARISRFHDHRPVLNSPGAVARTRRDLMPDLLGGIPDTVIPPVLRLRRDEVINVDLAARLAAGGVACPVLLRPIVTQGGGGLILIETPEQLAKVTFTDADAFYFIAYHDYRSADGYFRKYRMIFVDGKPYAYHLAISRNWLVHYFSADMLAAPWKREEERRFLENPAAALGATAMAAIETIGQRLGLDYGGIDFSLLPDGRVLVFEANATMAVHLGDSIVDFSYKHIYVPAIFKAFDAMLERRAQVMMTG